MNQPKTFSYDDLVSSPFFLKMINEIRDEFGSRIEMMNESIDEKIDIKINEKMDEKLNVSNKKSDAYVKNEAQQPEDEDKKMVQDDLKQPINQTFSALESIESSYRSSYRTRNRGIKGLLMPHLPRGVDRLDEDVYGIMMLTPPLSKAWCLGLVSFAMQAILGVILIWDLAEKDDVFDALFQVPITTTWRMVVTQLFVIILAGMTQSDVLIGIKMIFMYPLRKKNSWTELINGDHIVEYEPSNIYWYLNILLPNMLKILEGLLILVATFFLIIQQDSVVDLLKDYAALFVITSIDNALFSLADEGFFGEDCSCAATEVSKKKLDNPKGYVKWSFTIVLVMIILIMLSVWAYFVVGQYNGRYMKEKYPLCVLAETTESGGEMKSFQKLIGDRKCQSLKNTGPNILDCGWEGGDCEDFNDRYDNCFVNDMSKLGDKHCDWNEELYNSRNCGFDHGDCLEHNTAIDEKLGLDNTCIVDFPDKLADGRCDKDNNKQECEWDAGDCLEFNQEYPNCHVDEPEWVGDGWCNNFDLYNTPECNEDGNDCFFSNLLYPSCLVDEPNLLFDGVCQGEYNSEECGWDGGACIVDGFPNCHVDRPDNIGNGECDGVEYNTPECEWDGGDCVMDDYPGCHVEFPPWIGDGVCHGREYNSPECGWDGGDCIVDGLPDCHVDMPWFIGDGVCTGREYNIPECGWDGGDCVWFNEEYPTWIRDHPNCTVHSPWEIGDEVCENGNFGSQANTEDCGWEAGDCLDWNEWYPIWILDHPNCKVDITPHSVVGDGYCSGIYNTEECGWEGGDCLEFNEKFPDCTVDWPLFIGDGWCQYIDYNTTECGWDGGDCL